MYKQGCKLLCIKEELVDTLFTNEGDSYSRLKVELKAQKAIYFSHKSTICSFTVPYEIALVYACVCLFVCVVFRLYVVCV